MTSKILIFTILGAANLWAHPHSSLSHDHPPHQTLLSTGLQTTQANKLIPLNNASPTHKNFLTKIIKISVTPRKGHQVPGKVQNIARPTVSSTPKHPFADIAQILVIDSRSPKRTEIQKMIGRYLTVFFNSDYAEALAISREIQAFIPEHPIGYFYASVTYLEIIIDFNQFKYLEDFLLANKKTIETSQVLMKTERKEEPWGTFYYAGSIGFRGAYNFFFKSYFKGLRDGLVAYNKMNAIVKSNPTFYDAYYGLGIYSFFYGTYLGFFMSKYQKKRYLEKGISYTLLAYNKGVVTRNAAGAALLFLYALNDEHDKALRHSQFLIDAHPHFIGYQWGVATFLYQNDLYEEALARYAILRKKLAQNPYAWELSYLNLDVHSAIMLVSQGKKKQAKEILMALRDNAVLSDLATSPDASRFIREEYQEGMQILDSLLNP